MLLAGSEQKSAFLFKKNKLHLNLICAFLQKKKCSQDTLSNLKQKVDGNGDVFHNYHFAAMLHTLSLKQMSSFDY